MRELWERLTKGYAFEPEHLAVLQIAAEAWDRAAAARKQIEAEGMVIRTGTKTQRHPLLGIETDGWTVFLRAIRDLGLQGEVANESK
jgi:phage terminase small subunit